MPFMLLAALLQWTIQQGNVYPEKRNRHDRTFTGMVTGAVSNLQYAVYPADKYASGTMTLTFPATYTYPNSNAPMFGKLNSGKTSVDFVQLLSGMMCIKLTGLETGVSGSLVLAAPGIAGSAELTIDNSGNASLRTLSSTANEVTVSFTTVNTDRWCWIFPYPPPLTQTVLPLRCRLAQVLSKH